MASPAEIARQKVARAKQSAALAKGATVAPRDKAAGQPKAPRGPDGRFQTQRAYNAAASHYGGFSRPEPTSAEEMYRKSGVKPEEPKRKVYGVDQGD